MLEFAVGVSVVVVSPVNGLTPVAAEHSRAGLGAAGLFTLGATPSPDRRTFGGRCHWCVGRGS